jgi:hypothetical protein
VTPDDGGTDGGGDVHAVTGTFLVTAAGESDAGETAAGETAAGETDAVGDEAAVLRDVETGRVHTIAAHPGFESGEVVEGTVAPEPPLEVTWTVREVASRRRIPVERSAERPTALARDLAAEQAVGELTRRDRAGEGELHVLTVPPAETESAAEDVLADEETVARAARIGVDRVEVRADDGVLSVRYLP